MYNPKQTHVAQLFPESRGIIEACKDSKVPMAVASRSPTPPTARAFLRTLGNSSETKAFSRAFSLEEISECCKFTLES